MSVREYIMRKMSLRTNTPLKIIEKAIAHQFISAYGALKNNDSIEFSGLGKLVFNTKKAEKKLDIYNRKVAQCNYIIESAPSELKVKNANAALSIVQENIGYLLVKFKK